MANLMGNKARKTARAMIWVLMLFLVFQRVFPFIFSNFPHLWILIKRRKFIYIILNFIIISVLISSSSSFTPSLTNIFLKLYQKTKLLKVSFHDDDSCYNCQKAVDPSDDDTWWFFTTLDHEYIMTPSTGEDREEEYQIHVEEKETRKQEEEIGKNDSLDATWKAIMESKGKESGPQLKKSDRWSFGEDGGDQIRKLKGKGRLSKYRVKDELMEWQSSREIFNGGGDRKRGWRSVEGVLTFHDDLKKRADAFIARFTHDIHLQRLESDQRFLDMINRGIYE